MSASTYLVAPGELHKAQVGTRILLPASVVHHMKVARIAVGEEVHLVDGQGKRVIGLLAPGDSLEVESIVQESPTTLQITVAQALIKGDRLDRALEMMTEVGAAAFIPWAADHSVVKWTPDKASRNQHKWLNLAQAASEQSRRAFVPDVEAVVNSKELCQRFTDFDQVIVLEESEGSDLGANLTGSVLIVVGPEGGLSSAERQLFTAADNCVQLTLGNNVLRSATAGVVAISYLLTRSGEWDSRTHLIVKG